MFRNISPLFEDKKILTKSMLESLRDYPRSLFGILHQDYSDGILSGCGLSVRAEKLWVEPGILYRGRVPYLLEEPYGLEVEADGKETYLKICFEDRISGSQQEEYRSCLYLDGKAPDVEREMELARFKLQPGARLRDVWTDFEDYSTEFDTINRIHVPYAAPKRSSIFPEVLKSFARELLVSPGKEPWDAAFCMNALQTERAMPYEAVETYVNLRLERQRSGYTNKEVYDSLKQILAEARGKGRSPAAAGREGRKMLLI